MDVQCMSVLLTLAVLIALLGDAGQATTYKYVPTAVTWEEAAHLCEEMGYVLAHPEAEVENRELVEFLQATADSSADVWFGGTLDGSETWRWRTGAPVKWTDWSLENDQPNDMDMEKCVRFRDTDYKWWNRECDREYSFVCQLDQVKEARFSILQQDKVPAQAPMMTYMVTSIPECTIRCLGHYRCHVYSVQKISDNQSSCLLFPSTSEDENFRPQEETRVYSRQA